MKYFGDFFLLISLLAPFETVVTGSSNQLTSYLESRHLRSSPPAGRIIVEEELQLVHVIAVEEKNQLIKVLLHSKESWEDPSLSWDPAFFEGITETWLPSDVVWIPDIIVFNMLERVDMLQSMRRNVHVLSNGSVSFSSPHIFSVMCPMVITDFPFDSQQCALRIASWSYGEDKLQLRPAGVNNTLLNYTPNEEWALQEIIIESGRYAHDENVVAELRLVVKVERRPLFFVICLLLPTYIISALSLAGLFARFSTRMERQERFTLGVTATLTLAVLSLVVTEKVPHSSDQIPLLVIYFHANTLLITFATMLTAFNMWIATPRVHSTEKKSQLEWMLLADRLDNLFCVLMLVILTIPFLGMVQRCFALRPDRAKLSHYNY